MDRRRRVRHFSQILLEQWSSEYLIHVQERAKWAKEKGRKVDISSIVLIRDKNMPTLEWKIGRAVDVRAGND